MRANTIYSMFQNIVNEDPSALAVYDERKGLSRSELAVLADAMAQQIPDNAKRVGIVMDHGTAMIAAILAVLQKGAAYVPAEPFFPDGRIRFMMEDSAADLVITNAKYADRLRGMPLRIAEDMAGEAAKRRDAERAFKEEAHFTASCDGAKEDDLAYILYTSGSTGAPKGVSVRNRNVCQYVRAFQNEFHPGPSDTMLQYSVCSFDIFVEEVFTTLLSGAVLAIPSTQDKKDIHSLMAFVESNHVTQISGFPYLLLEMNSLEKIPKCLRLLISGGDVLRASYVDHLLPQASVYNTYGPSETTVCASYYCCNDGAPLADGTYPVGKAVLGSHIEIRNEALEKVADGEPGELCITGGGVSAGYTGDRVTENKAFVLQENGEVLYRSGDLGYVLPDGNIAFLHRIDTQVMILGKRVETTEVESVLCNCPEIRKAVVKAYTDEDHLSYLVAYIVTSQTEAPLSTIKKEMARFLPSYMIPEFFIRMQDMPLNANGKVDSKALPVVLKEGSAA